MTETSNGPRGGSEVGYFLIRRLHSLTGIIPIGVFLCFHLTINATVVLGPDKFQAGVDRIHALDELGVLKIVEVVGIFIPIAIHAVLGLQIWLTGRQNVLAYRYGANIRYTLQRWTALITLAFILFHVWQMHWLGGWFPPGGEQFVPGQAPKTAAEAIQSSAWYAPIYVIGVLAAVYHFANGIWTFLISWGVTVTRRVQSRVGYICAAVGIVFAAVGLSSLVVLKTTDPAALQVKPHEASHAVAVNLDPAD